MQRFDISGNHHQWHLLGGTDKSQAAMMTLDADQTTGGMDNRHDGDQWLLVLSGHGEAIVEGKRIGLAEKNLLLIEAGEAHEIRNIGGLPLITLNLYSPPQYTS